MEREVGKTGKFNLEETTEGTAENTDIRFQVFNDCKLRSTALQVSMENNQKGTTHKVVETK